MEAGSWKEEHELVYSLQAKMASGIGLIMDLCRQMYDRRFSFDSIETNQRP